RSKSSIRRTMRVLPAPSISGSEPSACPPQPWRRRESKDLSSDSCSEALGQTDPHLRLPSFLGKLLVSRFAAVRRSHLGQNQYAIAKCRALFRSQRKIQLLLAIRKYLPPQRIRRKQPVPARVPIGWKSRIPGMIQNRNRHRLIAHAPTQIAPTPPRAPY